MINHLWATLGEMGINHSEVWTMMRHTTDRQRTAHQQELINKIEALMLSYVADYEKPVNRVIQITIFESGKRNISMYSGV